MPRDQHAGKLSFLRVHDVGTGWGPSGAEHLDVEVVVIFRNDPVSDRAFGFKLRVDNQRAAHQGMLDLLRDAFTNDFSVTIEYDHGQNVKNGEIMRVALTK